MLDGLDEIPWKRLHHAYGTAEDVPGLIRAPAISDQQKEALYELFGNIWHQGTVYEASSFAVPFLFELAAEPTVGRRDEILGLIGALANGKSYLAVHAASGRKTSEFWRQKSDFEEKLAKEKEYVGRTRASVLNRQEILFRLLKDTTPMVRAGAAYVLSQYSEHATEFGPFIRQAINDETDQFARAAMLWCLGTIRDVSPDADTLLKSSVREYADPRQAFAAAIALYQIKGRPDVAAISIYRQIAAAKWFADSFLSGVPWDFSAEIEMETLLAEIEPDPAGATRTLLTVLEQADGDSYVCTCIMHDLLELNFDGGNWRQYNTLSTAQEEVLRRLVDTDPVWNDTKRLWFLIPKDARRGSQVTDSDVQKARSEMRSLLNRARISQ